MDGSAQREWNKITGALWGVPNLLIYKDRTFIPGDTGLPDAAASAIKPKPVEIWAQDERGSFNAVCGFLMRLGVRWYLPGELGEVLPATKTIALPKLDETVRPDFPSAASTSASPPTAKRWCAGRCASACAIRMASRPLTAWIR